MPCLCGVGEVQKLFQRQHGGFLPLVVLPCNECCAERAHNTGNIRAHRFCPGNLFKCPQHSLVVEGSALHHHVAAQLLRGRELDDLVKRVADHRAGEPCRYILYGSSFLLRLLHIGVHKNRAPCPEINRVGGEEGFLCKICRGISQRLGKVFYKRAATRRAGFIQEDVVHRAVFQPDAFHVLPANVQHAVDLRFKEGCRRAVGNGLHFALIQPECCFQQALAVSGGTGTHNVYAFRQLLLQLCHGPHRCLDRRALVAVIPGKEQLSLLSHQRKLCCGGACINAEEAVAPIGLQFGFRHHRLLMAGAEFPVFLLVGEERIHPFQFKSHGYAFPQAGYQLVNGSRLRIACFQRCPDRCKEMGIVRVDDGFIRQLQGADKCLLQLRQKVQRAAQKCHTATDRFPAGKAGYSLIHHRLEDGCRQVRLCRPFIDQWLDIAFGKNAAAGSNGVDLLIVGCRFIQPGSVRLQERRHLINESSRPAGTDSVHPFLQPTGEVDDLSVFTAQLNGNIGLRCGILQRRGNRHHLLHKADAETLAEVNGS